MDADQESICEASTFSTLKDLLQNLQLAEEKFYKRLGKPHSGMVVFCLGHAIGLLDLSMYYTTTWSYKLGRVNRIIKVF